MSLKRGFRMCLTNNALKFNICFVKTMVCNSLYVNDVNNKKLRSHVRSHDNLLKSIVIFSQCERVNDFSRTYVGNYFLPLLILFILSYTSIFIFFLSRARIFLFTCSHLIKINIKTMAYHVNEIKNSFTRRSHVHMGG